MSPEIDSFRQDIEAKARTAVAEIRNNPSSYDVHGNLTPLAAAALKAAQLALISFGAAAAVWDAHGSAERARALAQQGDMAGASREISGLAGRLYGGLLGFELGFAAGGLYLPAKIALGFGVGVLGVIVGDKAMRQLADWFSDLFGKDWLTVLEDGASAITRKLTDLARNILGDPIVLDLDGDGIELNSLASSLVRYDLDDDGLQERVGWVGAQDGLLFHDINGNGLVDGVAELFGSANVDGYDELKLLDSNNDTKISNLDAEFANLKVWQDLNQDGVSTSDEILTLAQAGIVRFNLNYVQLNAEVGGNITARKGSYVRADNASRDMASVWFGMDESVNRPVIPDYSDMSEYYQLPNLPAAASMPDLKTAMYFDSILKEMVDDLARGEFDFGSFADFAGLPITQPYSTFTTNGGGGIVIGSDLLTGEAVAGRFIETLYRWAGVDTSVAEDPDHPWHLQVFEAITGMPLELSNEHQRARFEEAWSELIGEWGVRFLVQAADQALLAPAYDMIAALEALDPQDPNFLQQASAIAEGGMAALNAPPVLAPFLAPFALLSIDPSTGEIEGDFDAFVHAYTKDEPEVTTSRISTGGGVVNYGDWLAWYQNQGKFIYSVAAAMNISSDAVNRVTGWRWMFGSIGDVEGTSGDDILEQASSSSAHIISTMSNGSISISNGTAPTRDQALYGYTGNDELRGLDGVDRLVGGVGDDLLKGGSGGDMYVYASGDGLDTIIDESGTDDVIYFSSALRSENLQISKLTGTNNLFLHFGDPAHGIILTNQWNSSAAAIEQFHFVGQDGLDAGDIATRYLATLVTSGNDVIAGSWASEHIVTLGGNDTVTAGDGNDTILGGDGDDALSGEVGNDSLTGGSGNDTMLGGRGADSYFYRLGDGDDVIDDVANDNEATIMDTLVFGGDLTADDLILSNVVDDFNSIVIGFVGQRGSIKIKSQNSTSGGIEAVVFSDESHWTLAELMARYVFDQQTVGHDLVNGSHFADSISSGNGDDVVVAGNGNDSITGGTGNDYFEGGYGADTYVYNLGDGHDIIYDQATGDSESSVKDTIVFGAGITAADLRFANVPDFWNDISISIAGAAGSIRIRNQSDNKTGIEAINFADGSSWTLEQLKARYVQDQQTIGHDRVHGTETTDSISSGAGNDVIVAGAGDDVIAGGTGNDYFEGAWGADTYVYNLGDGHDIIYDQATGDSESSVKDTIVFGAGITAADLRFANVPDFWNDISISIAGAAGSIRIRNQSDNKTGIEAINFADGSSWTLEQLKARYVQDQQTIGHDRVHGTETTDSISSGAGNDVIVAGAGDDVIAGGTGNDYFEGAWGADTYVYNLGDGHDIIYDQATSNSESSVKDTIVFGAGITAADVFIEPDRWNNASNLLIRFGSQPGSILVLGQSDNRTGIETIQFSDGTVWDAADIAAEFAVGLARVNAQAINGTSNAETLNGSADGDRIYAGAGDDTLIGAAGDDLLSGGAGHDTYVFNAGDGQDIISEKEHTQGPGGTDTLRFGLGIGFEDFILSKTTQDWGDVRITIAGTGDSILLDGQDNFTNFSSGWSYNRIENFIFQHEENGSIVETTVTWADLNLLRLAQAKTTGNDTIIGTNFADTIEGGEGNDTLYGWLNDDTLIGGAGDDLSTGGAGNDTYVFNLGDGQDTIFEDEHTQGPGGTDTLRFGLGISFEDFVLSKTTQDWGDVRITIAGTGDSILLDGQDNFTNFSSGWSYNRIENFIFQHEENGSIVETTVTWADLNLLRLAQAKTAGNDTIIGTNFADTIDGGSGGDTLYGWLGNDTLIGGSGGDLLTGGAGNDTYIFNHGDGSDTIFEDEDTQGPGGTDTLRFGLGIGFEDFILSKTTQDWGDVRITIAGTGDSILLDGQDNFTNYSSGWSYNRIENFIFQHEENGSIVETTVTWADFNLLRLAQAKTAGNDTIIGTNFADTIDGGNGGDTLYGWLGNDTLIGGAGNDVLDGGAGADTVLLSGLSASYSLATSGGALIITDNERDVDGDDGIDRLQAVEQLRFSDGEEVGIAAPIILDLDGGGVTTLSASASRSGFDMDGDGIADDTSWMGNGEGMLFLDRDGDGTLSNAGEFSFVGDLEGAASDLAGLRAFDSNGDGILSSADDRFADFRIWRDGDGDGIVGQGEVLALTGADVQSLDLGGIAVEGTAALGDVVTINMGSFTRTDGSSAAFIDAALTYFSGTVQNSITAPISQQIGPLSHHLLSTLDWDDSHRRRHRELQVDWQYGHDPIANWPQLGDRRMWSGQAISAIDDLNQLANSPISAPSPASSIDRQLAMIVQEMSVFGAQSAGEVLGPWQRENVRPQFEFFA